MKPVTLLLSSALLIAPAIASAEDEPGFFGRTLRGVSAFFGGDAATAEAGMRASGRFTEDEIAVIRAAMRDREERRYRRDGYRDRRDDDDYDYDDDYDDDDESRHGHKGKYKDKGKYKNKGQHKDKDRYRDDDDYYGDHADGGKKPKKLPPGLRKKLERGGELPPGWQKKFARGEVVSDDVWAQRQYLPGRVSGDLRVIPGTEVIQVGDRVARVLTDTREILDIIDLVTGP